MKNDFLLLLPVGFISKVALGIIMHSPGPLLCSMMMQRCIMIFCYIIHCILPKCMVVMPARVIYRLKTRQKWPKWAKIAILGLILLHPGPLLNGGADAKMHYHTQLLTTLQTSNMHCYTARWVD